MTKAIYSSRKILLFIALIQICSQFFVNNFNFWPLDYQGACWYVQMNYWQTRYAEFERGFFVQSMIYNSTVYSQTCLRLFMNRTNGYIQTNLTVSPGVYQVHLTVAVISPYLAVFDRAVELKISLCGKSSSKILTREMKLPIQVQFTSIRIYFRSNCKIEIHEENLRSREYFHILMTNISISKVLSKKEKEKEKKEREEHQQPVPIYV